MEPPEIMNAGFVLMFDALFVKVPEFKYTGCLGHFHFLYSEWIVCHLYAENIWPVLNVWFLLDKLEFNYTNPPYVASEKKSFTIIIIIIYIIYARRLQYFSARYAISVHQFRFSKLKWHFICQYILESVVKFMNKIRSQYMSQLISHINLYMMSVSKTGSTLNKSVHESLSQWVKYSLSISKSVHEALIS